MENTYKNLILNAPFGYLSIKAQLSNKGDIIDFKVIEANLKFQEIINMDQKALFQKSSALFLKIFLKKSLIFLRT